MNYYNEIKNKIIEEEVYRKVKNFSIEKNRLAIYVEIGKLLFDAGNIYGNNVIKKYSIKLSKELNKNYNVRYLFDIRKLYLFIKVHPLGAQLTISHCRLLFRIKNHEEINYYINQSVSKNLGKRELEAKIKSKEYERLPEITKNKLINKEETNIKDIIPNPIIITNKNNIEIANEYALHQLILENISDFMEQLGSGYAFIKNEYKIKIGNRYNYIDLLLYNIEYNCYVIIELKVTELKKEHIGQIEVYMNYIDNHLRNINQDKTIGIIISKKDNKFVMEYVSDERILSREYEIIV